MRGVANLTNRICLRAHRKNFPLRPESQAWPHSSGIDRRIESGAVRNVDRGRFHRFEHDRRMPREFRFGLLEAGGCASCQSCRCELDIGIIPSRACGEVPLIRKRDRIECIQSDSVDFCMRWIANVRRQSTERLIVRIGAEEVSVNRLSEVIRAVAVVCFFPRDLYTRNERVRDPSGRKTHRHIREVREILRPHRAAM